MIPKVDNGAEVVRVKKKAMDIPFGNAVRSGPCLHVVVKTSDVRNQRIKRFALLCLALASTEVLLHQHFFGRFVHRCRPFSDVRLNGTTDCDTKP